MNTLAIGSAVGTLSLALVLGCSSDKKDTKESESAQSASADLGTLLAVGTPAPDFTAEAHDGSTVSISSLKGQPAVLYFYPKDETPG